MANKGYVTVGSLGAAAPCLPLVDGFSGTSLDSAKWDTYTTAGASVSESGNLFLSVPSGGGIAAAYSVDHYDLTGLGAQVEVVDQAAPGQQLWLGLMAAASPSTAINVWATAALFLGMSAGTLYFGHGVSGSQYFDVSSMAFDPVSHKFWRIAERGGNIYWSTSKDGISWTDQGGLVGHPFDITSVYPLLQADGNSAESCSFSNFGSDVAGLVFGTAVVLASDGSVVASSGNGLPERSVAGLSYGDSAHAIHDALEAAVRADAGDSSLSIEFIS